MDAGAPHRLTSVKPGLLRHPAVIGAAGAALVALLATNAVAFARGLDSPWLLGAVIVSDMLVIGAGVLLAAREVLTAHAGTVEAEAEAQRMRGALTSAQARLGAIVDSAMDAVITVDAS